MTLNITLAAPWGIHQSTNLRLKDADTSKIIDDASPKQIKVNGFSWFGVIAYSGFGRWQGRDTCEAVSGWLPQNKGWKNPEDVAEIIRVSGGQWLAQIWRRTGKRWGHTFILGAFVGSKPSVFLISNFERFDEKRRDTPLDKLVVTAMQPREARGIITGSSEAVTQDQETYLKSLLKAKPEPLVIRRAMATAPQKASSHRKARGSISPSCMAYSLLPDGTGAGERHGEVSGELIPHAVVIGIDMVDAVRGIAQRTGMKEPELVQATSAYLLPQKK